MGITPLDLERKPGKRERGGEREILLPHNQTPRLTAGASSSQLFKWRFGPGSILRLISTVSQKNWLAAEALGSGIMKGDSLVCDSN